MSKSINVTPQTLETQSKLVTGKVNEYNKLYERLIDEVQQLSANWQGQGNKTYANQITNFRPKFQDLEKVLRNYAEFLIKAAKVYRDTEDNIITNAGKLAR